LQSGRKRALRPGQRLPDGHSRRTAVQWRARLKWPIPRSRQARSIDRGQQTQQFTLNVIDRANHGAAYLQAYITKQGFDPLTQPLTWNSVELVTTAGKQLGQTGISNYTANVDAGNRTGRHVILTIWQGYWVDQTYFSCSDVILSATAQQASRQARFL